MRKYKNYQILLEFPMRQLFTQKVNYTIVHTLFCSNSSRILQSGGQELRGDFLIGVAVCSIVVGKHRRHTIEAVWEIARTASARNKFALVLRNLGTEFQKICQFSLLYCASPKEKQVKETCRKIQGQLIGLNILNMNRI